MEWKKRYRRWLCGLLAVTLLLTGVYYYKRMMQVIPDHITIEAGNPNLLQIAERPEDFFRQEVIQTSGTNASVLPDNAVSIEVEQQQGTGTDPVGYTIECKFLGILGMKNVRVDVIEDQKLYAGGFPVGIYVETDGVMVIGSGKITGMDGNEYEPAKNILKSGDYILSVNGRTVSSKEELIDVVNAEGANPVVLEIRRNNEKTRVKIVPVQTSKDEYRIGAWIRDNTQGVGMFTFMTESGEFGALGHGITDVDTGLLMEIEDGQLLDTEIVSVVKGQEGTPGELVGMIDYRVASELGTIHSNTQKGIFGTAQSQCRSLCTDAMPIALKKNITTGPAGIRTCVDGEIKEYAIEIVETYPNSSEENKSFLIEITDEELLKKTGGIVQGMSGSPIIQDGKLIGAVTHVLVNNPTRGYGIFIENMLEH